MDELINIKDLLGTVELERRDVINGYQSGKGGSMMPAKIIKFGQITEDSNGDLVFENFHFDFANQYKEHDIGVLRLVIDRLEDELMRVISATKEQL
jgi:hypothetical protein